MPRLFFSLLAALVLLTGCSGVPTPRDLQPTVILISIDGFHPDYLEQYDTPNLNALADEGVAAEAGMLPIFPTLTFPNHYSIATGLYAAGHGIVSNTIYDPDMDATFRISDREAVEDPRWWGGEPIWVTAEKQGQRAATYFWVGSEAPVQGVRPTYWKQYDASIPHEQRVEDALGWIDLGPEERPTFLSLYFSSVDGAGHRFGPDAPETREAVEEVDARIGDLMQGLRDRKILDRVHLIIVSDHGMAPVSRDRLVVLEDYIDLDDVRITDSGAKLMLWPDEGKEDAVLFGLRGMPHLTLLPDSVLAEQYKYTGNRRIPPVVGVADDGWTIAIERQFVEDRPDYPSGGAHGYAPELESMRALFIAHGPEFVSGSNLEPFENIHVYPLMTRLLGLEPAEVDGRLDVFEPVLKP